MSVVEISEWEGVMVTCDDRPWGPLFKVPGWKHIPCGKQYGTSGGPPQFHVYECPAAPSPQTTGETT